MRILALPLLERGVEEIAEVLGITVLGSRRLARMACNDGTSSWKIVK